MVWSELNTSNQPQNANFVQKIDRGCIFKHLLIFPIINNLDKLPCTIGV